VEEIEDARQIRGGEIVSAGARIESTAQPEVDGVRSRGDRCSQALLVPCGCEQLGFWKCFHHSMGAAVCHRASATEPGKVQCARRACAVRLAPGHASCNQEAEGNRRSPPAMVMV